MPDSPQDLHKKLLGKKGEQLVEEYLKNQGCKILKRNYRTPCGEADIIMEKDGITVFVEVKTRSSDVYGEPKDAVGYRKQEKYKKIAQYYKLRRGEMPVSFAVVEVIGDSVNLIENAF